jgi:hypothetical protein
MTVHPIIFFLPEKLIAALPRKNFKISNGAWVCANDLQQKPTV